MDDKIRWFDRLWIRFYIFLIKESATIIGLFYKQHRKDVLRNLWLDYWRPLLEGIAFIIFAFFVSIFAILKYILAIVFLIPNVIFNKLRQEQIQAYAKEIKKHDQIKI